MNELKPPENGYRSRIRTSTLRLLSWNAAWVAATALMMFGPKLLWDKASVFTVVTVCLDVVMGVAMIVANKKYIAELDELQRRIHLNALATAVGVGLIAGVPYSVLDAYHVIQFHANFGHLVILMSVTFLVSFVYGNWRYR